MPCDVKAALCFLKPWWAVLDSHYTFKMHSNYPCCCCCYSSLPSSPAGLGWSTAENPVAG